ncbi:MAG: 1-deoxy-D-xylulose-5-phosphate synthase, partial [Lachnospiraceae bacterium]|nr:1-deoxy-D-xylulose-5-phosphate synthase [Lachnospiraceae bacterium]
MSWLEKINRTGDIHRIPPEAYDELAAEIREFLVQKVSQHGGHLASNLGAVELTMALHLAYDPTYDKIVWDVGHQSYTHKILTGRKAGFDELREFGGMSGFPKRRESITDVYETGHSTTAVSAAMGMAEARDLFGDHYHVVAVLGDGALTGGLAYEGLNDAGTSREHLLVLLNDNGMSITENVGALSR